MWKSSQECVDSFQLSKLFKAEGPLFRNVAKASLWINRFESYQTRGHYEKCNSPLQYSILYPKVWMRCYLITCVHTNAFVWTFKWCYYSACFFFPVHTFGFYVLGWKGGGSSFHRASRSVLKSVCIRIFSRSIESCYAERKIESRRQTAICF